MAAQLEHANLTVTDPDATAKWMCDLFDWHIRWAGPALQGGRSVHVGTTTQYLALYSPGDPKPARDSNYTTVGGLNHLAITTEDIDSMERAVTALGFTPTNHGDYEPGKRFYFHDQDGIEYEVVQYD